ncbi:MAG TPA: antitoxin AF2212-like protein [Blastocatellia bacterium]|nr:antitoxin AF2212-like protein [Blastocatellia bacterium]
MIKSRKEAEGVNLKVTTIYENGVLRPLAPLDLPEHSEVHVEIQQVLSPEAASTLARKVRHALLAAGLSLPTGDVATEAATLSDERREELARLFSAERPLAELISEDREGR